MSYVFGLGGIYIFCAGFWKLYFSMTADADRTDRMGSIYMPSGIVFSGVIKSGKIFQY